MLTDRVLTSSALPKTLDGIVDKSIVDREVSMDEPVTHAHDAPPRDFRMADNHIIR
jgi:hypothetical protein